MNAVMSGRSRNWWSQQIRLADLRRELRERGGDDWREALALLRGRGQGRVYYTDVAWHAWPHIAAELQRAGRRILAGDPDRRPALWDVD